MVDRDRILSKVAELDAYLRELDSIHPASREQYEIIHVVAHPRLALTRYALKNWRAPASSLLIFGQSFTG
jgi:hypothetical protein